MPEYDFETKRNEFYNFLYSNNEFTAFTRFFESQFSSNRFNALKISVWNFHCESGWRLKQGSKSRQKSCTTANFVVHDRTTRFLTKRNSLCDGDTRYKTHRPFNSSDLTNLLLVKRASGRWPAHRTGKKPIIGRYGTDVNETLWYFYEMSRSVDLCKGHMNHAMNSHNLNIHHSFRQTQFNQGFHNVLQRLLAKGWDFSRTHQRLVLTLH